MTEISAAVERSTSRPRFRRLLTELVVKPVREALRAAPDDALIRWMLREKAVMIKAKQFVDALWDDNELRTSTYAR
jgi:hypothetical protein